MRQKAKLSATAKIVLWVVSPFLVLSFIFLCIGLLFYALWHHSYRLYLRLWFELTLGSAGKRVLLVYSRSPNWQQYIESRWLPELEPHVFVVNWSDRSTWGHFPSLPVRLFRFYSGRREYNPMVVLFPRSGRARVIRFFKAFRDLKHGKPLALTKAENELFLFREKLDTQRA